MPNTKKNTLAELASHLNPDRVTNDDLDKAQRIVAVLAKVSKDYEDNYGSRGYYISCRDAFENCLAIAEEGAEDGSQS